jgi:hypothetical protein
VVLPSGNETTAERRVCNDCHAQFLRCIRKSILLDPQLKRTVFYLHRHHLLADPLNGLGPPKRIRTALAQAKPPDFSALDIRAQRLEHDLDGDLRVDTVLVVQVDVVRLEHGERPFDGCPDVRGLADGPHDELVRPRVACAKLGGEEYLGTATGLGEPFPQELFRCRSVNSAMGAGPKDECYVPCPYTSSDKQKTLVIQSKSL